MLVNNCYILLSFEVDSYRMLYIRKLQTQSHLFQNKYPKSHVAVQWQPLKESSLWYFLWIIFVSSSRPFISGHGGDGFATKATYIFRSQSLDKSIPKNIICYKLKKAWKTQTLVKKASVSSCSFSKFKYVGRIPINLSQNWNT